MSAVVRAVYANVAIARPRSRRANHPRKYARVSRTAGRFTVDTHLFRELGQLLVGRDSTALIELVKNAYDADALDVTVFGQHLDDPQRGIIRIVDSGVGMTEEEFKRGFLRIASRMKEQGRRVSRKFERRYTGAKGIGRLAAHKLARHVEVESIPWAEHAGAGGVTGLVGRIDWDKVEASETLEEVSDDAVSVELRHLARATKPGTTIVLRRLRQRWTKAQLGAFLTEVDSFQAPRLLTDRFDQRIVGTETLFASPRTSDTGGTDPGFTVTLEGDFAGGDQYWPTVLDSCHWLLEIDASADGIRYGVYPTGRKQREVQDAEVRTFHEGHPDPRGGPFFQARILVREGSPEAKHKGFAARAAGIRVFMEGFRVLPYGDAADDWLEIARDYGDRSRKLRFLEEPPPELEGAVKDEGLIFLPNKHYFGGVFLTQAGAESLSMLVNREGFVPDVHFERLRKLVRRGVDLLTRARASLNARAEQREREGGDLKTPPERRIEVEHAFAQLQDGAEGLRTLAAQLPQADARKMLAVVAKMETAARLSKEHLSSERMTRVLASVGLQLAAFTHELNTVLGMAATIETAMLRVKERSGLPVPLRGELVRLASAVGDLRRNVERQAAHLVDVVTPDARRRRSRQKLAERFNAARRFVDRIAEARAIEIKNDIGADLRSPAMFSAELTTAFTNLLTNALKAAGEHGRIRASADQKDDGSVVVRLENTGVAVDLADAERWFRPFESTTTETDPVLGQGMGLGLTITRDILAEVGAGIEFVSPRKSYATAVQITFPR